MTIESCRVEFCNPQDVHPNWETWQSGLTEKEARDLARSLNAQRRDRDRAHPVREAREFRAVCEFGRPL